MNRTCHDKVIFKHNSIDFEELVDGKNKNEEPILRTLIIDLIRNRRNIFNYVGDVSNI